MMPKLFVDNLVLNQMVSCDSNCRLNHSAYSYIPDDNIIIYMQEHNL